MDWLGKTAAFLDQLQSTTPPHQIKLLTNVKTVNHINELSSQFIVQIVELRLSKNRKVKIS